MEREQGDGEGVVPCLQLFPPRYFVCRIGSGREERLQVFFGTVVFCGIGQHEQAGFVILALPGLKKVIGCGECGDVGGTGTCSEGSLGLSRGGRGQQNSERKNQKGEGRMPSR